MRRKIKRIREWNEKAILRREERKDGEIDGWKRKVSGKSAIKERGNGGGERCFTAWS